MENSWLILSPRYGGDTPAPTLEDLRSALVELYEENLPSMTLADYEEHPVAYVRHGTDTGPMYVLYINRSKTATFEQWSDQDFQEEIADPITIENVSREEALAMWLQLQSGQIEALRRNFEHRGKS